MWINCKTTPTYQLMVDKNNLLTFKENIINICLTIILSKNIKGTLYILVKKYIFLIHENL